MRKTILTALILMTSIKAFNQSKKDTVKALKIIDSTFNLNTDKAIGLFNLLSISQEAIAHTTSSKITVEEANQVHDGVAYFQNLIKEWIAKFQKNDRSLKK